MRPLAVNDNATTDEDTEIVIDVLANDTDADGHTLTVDSVTDPAHGSVVNNGTDISYTPDAHFNGSDSFSYKVIDGNGGSDTATVTVSVNAINDAPVANDDEVTVDEDIETILDILANDSDADGDTLTIDSMTDPANGSLVKQWHRRDLHARRWLFWQRQL